MRIVRATVDNVPLELGQTRQLFEPFFGDIVQPQHVQCF